MRAEPSAGAGLSEVAAQVIIDAAPDGIVMVDGEGRLVLANRRVEEVFGYGPGELLGRSIEVLVPEDLRARHAQYRHGYDAAPRVREMGAGLELVGLRRDGTTVPVEISLSPVATPSGGHHVLAIIRDVSQRKADEESVRRLQRLLDTSTEAVFLAHAETLELVYVNDGAVSLSGRGRRELLDLALDEILPGLADVVDGVAGDGEEAAAANVGLRARRASGEEVECDVLLQHFDWGGRIWLAAFVRDITDRLRAEEEHRRAEQAEALVEQQERIARDLHDTVIQSLFGIGLSLQAAAGLAKEPMVAERLNRAVDDLDRSIRSLRTTVFSLHEPSPVTGGLRQHVAATVEEASRSLGFTPSVRFHGPVDYTVPEAVQEQLVPCLREALANVARHAEASRVDVELSVAEEITLEVRDDGVGIPAAPRRGEGLDNLEHRAARLGGSCQVVAAPEGGTVVRWSVPVP